MVPAVAGAMCAGSPSAFAFYYVILRNTNHFLCEDLTVLSSPRRDSDCHQLSLWTVDCWSQVRDDGEDSGVGSVGDEDGDGDGRLRDESLKRSPERPEPQYPQFQDNSGDLLKPCNPDYPDVSHISGPQQQKQRRHHHHHQQQQQKQQQQW